MNSLFAIQMNVLLQTISHYLQNVAASVTILSVIIAFFRERYGNLEQTPASTKYPLGHKEVFPALGWILRISVGIYIVATCVLLYLSDVPNNYLHATIVTFIVLVICFVSLSILGRKSLDSRFVIAPKVLWQMLFNRIPSYLEECDGPFRIYILSVGVKEECTQEDDTDGLLTETIKEQINNKIKDIIKSKEGQSFREKDKPLYDIIVNDDPFYRRTDKDNIHGIIVFVGNGMATEKVDSTIRVLADKFPNASIGYYSYGSYPADFYPPYINLKHLRVEDYIDHLVFRYYARSKAWQRLSKTYHTGFLWLFSILAVVLLSIAGSKIYQNCKFENTKMVLSSPEQSVKSNFTRLVNSILVSPKPADVKLWVRDTALKVTINTHRYAEQGDTSKRQNDSSIIASVIKARVFLLYDRSQECPYMVWNCDGKQCEGFYDPVNDAYSVMVAGRHHVFKWVPSKEDRRTYDDMRIRVMYSYDSSNAVEVIYGYGDSKKVWKAANHSETFLLPIQQFLVAATLEDIKLDK